MIYLAVFLAGVIAGGLIACAFIPRKLNATVNIAIDARGAGEEVTAALPKILRDNEDEMRRELAKALA